MKNMKIPFFDNLSKISQKKIYSFHALPLSYGHILSNLYYEEEFRKLYETDFLKFEVTLNEQWVDNALFPEKTLRTSEKQASAIFEVDSSFYITSGTSVSNQIVLDAILERGDRVLVEKNVHKSIHFSLNNKNANISYVNEQYSDNQSGRKFTNFEEMINDFELAYKEGKPFKTVILNASSYEGVTNNIPYIVEQLVLIDSNITILVDEAWFAFAKFNKLMGRYSILSTANALRSKYPELNIVVTQSLHKSLPCMRQASIIHVLGSSKIIEKIAESKFKIHTTSPSYSILASIDLACAEMCQNGEALVSQALKKSKEIRKFIDRLENLSINSELEQEFWSIDPFKLSVNFHLTQKESNQIKTIFEKHNIFVIRYTECSFLLNFHIGVTDESIEKLKEALVEIDSTFSEEELEKQSLVSDEYIIPYPPGVPMVFPGDLISREKLKEMNKMENNGIHMIHIKKEGEKYAEFITN